MFEQFNKTEQTHSKDGLDPDNAVQYLHICNSAYADARSGPLRTGLTAGEEDRVKRLFSVCSLVRPVRTSTRLTKGTSDNVEMFDL